MTEVGSPKSEVGRAKSQKLRAGLKILIVLVVSLGLTTTAHADKITLKNGKVYEGKVFAKSDRRYIFSLNLDGDSVPISFFIDQVEKVELSQDTVEAQIPYLKEVENMKVSVKPSANKFYEFSLYNKSQNQAMAADLPFTEADVKKLLNKEELEYYQRYNQVLGRYADKLVEVQDIYANLLSATKSDFARVRQSMDELYYELDNIPVPGAFKPFHANYLEYVKATYLAFNALDKGLLDAASRQTKISEESKARSVDLFRGLIDSRRAQTTSEKSRS